MQNSILVIVFFFYGLAFFSMGLAITVEQGRSANTRLSHALLPLAAFGYLHGAHEWIEMFQLVNLFPGNTVPPLLMEAFRLAILSFSFLSLGAFGSYLLAPDEQYRRISMLIPLLMATLWGFGILYFRGRYGTDLSGWAVADVWTRYVLGIVGAVLASIGLITQQKNFREAGLETFGRDSLWAAVAFAWYGLVGQIFTRQSLLPPSTFLNSELFLTLFGFPVQILRAGAAILAAIFIIRVLRAFDVETRNQIDALRYAQVQEAQRREALQRELFKRVVAAQEAERQRIGRELHDETGQSLTAIGLGLRGIATTLRQNPDKSTKNLLQIENMTAEALVELQRLIADLRPSHLDDLGLPAALRWYAGMIQERAPIQLDIEVQGEPVSLSSEIKTTIFRIVQEALTNVIKHSNAEHVNVHLTYAPEEIKLQVKDNGRGFDMSLLENPSRPSWGLIGMQERASLLGGSFYIFSVPGRGTLIEITMPYQDGEKENENTPASGG